MWHWGYGTWWMALMMIVFWVGVAAVIVWIVRTSSHRSGDDSGSRALDVLDERYARGEIDDDEYHRRRETLRGD